ncbi:MAG: IS110 family transposase [Nitrospira sp.]|nr:MAG: IS110 family transposase [Nitrospira sp.]
MATTSTVELRVSVDVGARRHHVAIGLSSGDVLEEFAITHHPEGFAHFFARIETYHQHYPGPVAVAMEGYNGYARPLDQLIQARGYRLYNINNLKLARFKEIFPGAAKTDRLDARKGLELFQLREHLPVAKAVLQEVGVVPAANARLKRLTRRRRRLVNERVRVLNTLQADLQAVCPGLLDLTREVGNQWFLHLLVSADTLPQLTRLRKTTLLNIPCVGRAYARIIQDWQPQAQWSPEVEWVGAMIQEDAQRVLDLDAQIAALETTMHQVAQESTIATTVASLPGFGPICTAELAGEIGTVTRFQQESSLALYLGMATLDNSSGTRHSSKPPKQVNVRAKAAMMIAVDRHRKQIPESQRYYEKKRQQGKSHNQAIRAGHVAARSLPVGQLRRATKLARA